MPYRDRAQVERWLSEFWDSHSLFVERLTILDDSFVPHANSGIVVATLRRTPGMTYLSVKVVDGRPRWMVTFDERQDAVDLDASGVLDLAREVDALATLCAYLQERTDRARIDPSAVSGQA